MPLPDGWNEDDGRSLINRLAFNESMYFAKMKGAVQEHLKSMPREAVQSVRELRLWDALYNSVSSEFQVVKIIAEGIFITVVKFNVICTGKQHITEIVALSYDSRYSAEISILIIVNV